MNFNFKKIINNFGRYVESINIKDLKRFCLALHNDNLNLLQEIQDLKKKYNKKTKEIRRLIKSKKIFSLSTHNFVEIWSFEHQWKKLWD